MKKRKIITSVINNYEGDQRVQKVCGSLRKFGFETEVIATDLRGTPTLDFPYKVHTLPLKNSRGMKLYFEFNRKLFFRLKKIAKKEDILLANDLDSLLPNYLVSKLKGCELVFDSHEIFSEVPSLHKRPFRKKTWKRLERFILPKIKHFYTVSNGYADWFEKEYGRRPEVIRNVPSLPLNKDDKLEVILPEVSPGEKIILYQGILNFSRGIDKMIMAMQHLSGVQLWIVGDGPKRKEFEDLTDELQLRSSVKFIGSVRPGQLRLITPKADLGLSLEEDYGISYRYALPNKIFDYTHAGIPMLATLLPEIKNTVETYGIGKTIKNHEPKHIAERIKEMLDEGKLPYADNLKKAAEIFNWGNEEQKLKAIYSAFKVHI